MLRTLAHPLVHAIGRCFILRSLPGLRVSELVGLGADQFDASAPATIHVMGKGRRERVLPLWRETTVVIQSWLAVRPQGLDTALFLNSAGRVMTRSGFRHSRQAR